MQEEKRQKKVEKRTGNLQKEEIQMTNKTYEMFNLTRQDQNQPIKYQ